MGPPIKLTVAGETVFICCEGCREQAFGKPTETLGPSREVEAKQVRTGTCRRGRRRAPSASGRRTRRDAFGLNRC